MNRILARALPLLTIFILAACSQNSLRGSFVPQTAPSFAQATGDGDVPFVGPNPVRRLCGTPAGSDRMECFAMVRTDVSLMPQLSSQIERGAETCPFEGRAYCPIDLQEAYKLPSLIKGADRVVAIVDAFGYKHAAGDLAVYRRTMGLKPCVTATKCLRIVNQHGNPSPLPHEPPPSDDWRGEQSLDLDMVSAICPNCKIILVQTNDNFTSDLYAGVKTAGRFAKYISNSWGGGETGGDNAIFHQDGVVITAAAGDNGGGGPQGGAAQPCTYTYVVCVGGTHLTRNAHVLRGWSESVWNDWTLDACGSSGNSPCGATGSGCSRFIAKPLWQNDKGCRMRSESDVSATASLRSPVAVYNSELGCPPSQCWFAFGGTSVSTPIVASVYALAGNAGILTGAERLWKHHSGHLNDVFFGNNIDLKLGIRCASPVKYICTAGLGFDGPTGWGTPKGIDAF